MTIKKDNNKMILTVESLSKSFGSNHVLKGVDLKVKQYESLAVIGQSGSGKSVLFKSIIGLLIPDSGKVNIMGKDLEYHKNYLDPEVEDNIGVLFQGGALFDSLNLWQNICFSQLNQKKITYKQAKELAAEKLKQVGLSPDLIYSYPNELSGGMQKRAAFARTIVKDPKLVFFDEPTTGLDPILTATINNLIDKLSHEHGVTTITITHDIRNLKQFADRVAMLANSKLVWSGSYDELWETDHPIVANFVRGNIAEYERALLAG